MNDVSVAFSALATVSVLLAISLIGLLGRLDVRRVTLSAGIGAAVTGLGCVVHFLSLPVLLIAPVVALGALFAALATSALRGSTVRLVALSVVATAALFLPLSVAVFGGVFDPFGTQLGVIDLGGGVPVLVAGGAVAVGTGLVSRRAAVPSAPIPWARAWPILPLWAVWIGWLVGLELAADDMVPIILASAVSAPLAAGIGGALVERMRFRRTTPSGVVTAVLAGLAAATPACAYVTVPIAVLIGLAVGAVSGLVPLRIHDSVAGTVAVGAAISTVLLGAVATDLSFIYTGQPELLFGQLFIVVLAAAGGLVVGAAAGWRRRG